MITLNPQNWLFKNPKLPSMVQKGPKPLETLGAWKCTQLCQHIKRATKSAQKQKNKSQVLVVRPKVAVIGLKWPFWRWERGKGDRRGRSPFLDLGRGYTTGLWALKITSSTETFWNRHSQLSTPKTDSLKIKNGHQLSKNCQNLLKL